jgi:hypothetical protein
LLGKFDLIGKDFYKSIAVNFGSNPPEILESLKITQLSEIFGQWQEVQGKYCALKLFLKCG